MSKKALIPAALLLATALVAAFATPPPKRLSIPGGRVVRYADGSPMCVYLSADDKFRIDVDLARVDPDYIEALVAYEDQRFYLHPGVDPVSIARAAWNNLAAGEVVSGASTITMQLVRLVEPRPRTLRSKIVEALRAVQIELLMTKKEILEAYLTFVSYGGNLEGIEAASYSYFGHGPEHLDAFETAYLISVPQRPNDRAPGRGAEAATKAVAHVAGRLLRQGAFDEEQAARALSSTPPSKTTPLPRENLHAARFIAERAAAARVKSHIDRHAQAVVERALAARRAGYERLGINNAAAVVIEARAGRVVAAVGNFDFWDENGGQVIGFDAPRSPGSALKPFIYAMAIDRGVALPEFMAADTPLSYPGYRPVNYDKEFRGLVRLEDALSQSLNIPFVSLLHEAGLDEFLALLREGGITTVVDEPGYYGLSVAIGAMEVKLHELTGLYGALAADGAYTRPAWFEGDEKGRERARLFEPGAAYLTRRALAKRGRPDYSEHGFVKAPERVFWKTGTSSGQRDAWAAGSAYGYVAGVWVGNFDGRPSPHLSGASAAGPILFDVLEGLRRALPEDRERPDGLIEIELCAFSGRPAGPDCPETAVGLALERAVPRESCPYHARLLVDRESGLRRSPLCAADRDAVERVFTVLPARVRRWAKGGLAMVEEPPPWAPGCSPVSSAAPPRIVAPVSGAVYLMTPGMSRSGQSIPLEASADGRDARLHWFVDGRHLESAPAHRRVWLEPAEGVREIRVVDSRGAGHTVRIRVVNPL